MKISLKSDMRFPGFKILDRYILRRFLQTYAFAIAMITVVLVVFDYAERVDDFTELKAPFSAIIFDYYLNFVPDFINQYSGLFTFIAVIFFTSKMAYQTEIIAMLSGGMSFMRLMWPYFLGALVITLLSLALNLWVIPVSQISCVEFEQKYFKSNQTVQYDRHIYRQIEPGEFVYVRGFNRSNRASYMALERYEGTSIAESLEASDVTVDPETGRWHAQRYILRHITPDGEEAFEHACRTVGINPPGPLAHHQPDGRDLPQHPHRAREDGNPPRHPRLPPRRPVPRPQVQGRARAELPQGPGARTRGPHARHLGHRPRRRQARLHPPDHHLDPTDWTAQHVWCAGRQVE